MKNGSFENNEGLNFGDFSTKNTSEGKENGNEKVDTHEEGVHEFFRLIDAQNHHLPPS